MDELKEAKISYDTVSIESKKRNLSTLKMISFFRSQIDRLVQLTDTIIVSKAWRYIPATIFATSLITTACLREIESHSIVHNLSEQLDGQLLRAIYPIQWRIGSYDQILSWIHWLFDSSKTVTREGFRSYIDSLDLQKNFPEIPEVTMSYKVAKGDLWKHISSVQEEWFLDYGKNLKNTEREYYAPVVYIEPFTIKNQYDFGYNNFSSPTRSFTMKQAQDQDESVLSDPLCLVQDKAGKTHSSFVMFHPIYWKKIENNTKLEREKNIFGWSAIAFRFPDLITQVSHDRFSDIDLRVYSGKEENVDALLFDSVQWEKATPRFWIKKTKVVNISGQNFTFVVRSTDAFENSMHHHEYLDNIVYSGAIVTFLLTLFSFIFIKSRREALVTISSLKESTKKIMDLAIHDGLTGLPNRIWFLNWLNVLLSQADRNKTSVALMFIDLDKFKYVNDTHGHHVGDELLRQVTTRMQHCIRAEDILGRQGGDEFLLALSELKNPDGAAGVAKKIINALALPFRIQEQKKELEVFIGSSIGIAMYPDDADDSSKLQKYADMAMYKVKNNGRNAFHFYSDGMQASSEEYQLIVTALHHAIERQEFSMVYQPIVDTTTGNIVSMEALLRWKHPEFWSISPATFIPIAEADTETIISIGKWTIYLVCSQIAEWKKSWTHIPKIAVNLSARQFLSKNLVSDILKIIQETWVAPHEISFEITEGTLFRDFDSAIFIIQNLSDIGFDISIDDFGTGYSSLSRLGQFKISKLKIDRTFILDIGTEKWDQMLDGIIALAHKLWLQVIAEWVEYHSQVDVLKALGCDYIQGYLYGKPKPADETLPLLAEQDTVIKN